MPKGYLDNYNSNKDMLVKLLDTNNNYEWIIPISTEMRAKQDKGFMALIKQLGLEKDDGEVNVIQQTDF